LPATGIQSISWRRSPGAGSEAHLLRLGSGQASIRCFAALRSYSGFFLELGTRLRQKQANRACWLGRRPHRSMRVGESTSGERGAAWAGGSEPHPSIHCLALLGSYSGCCRERLCSPVLTGKPLCGILLVGAGRCIPYLGSTSHVLALHPQVVFCCGESPPRRLA